MNFLERTRRYGRDEELSKELLFSMAYAGTAYEHPEEGYVKSVESITLDDIKQFYSQYYVRNNTVVAVGGGFPDGFVGRVRQDFDALPEAQVATLPAPDPKWPEGIHVLLVDKPTDATPISIGFPTMLLRGDPEFFGMMAMNSWFGQHRESFSHLYQVIREARGMNYGDYSYIEAFPAGYATQLPRVNVGRRSQLFEIWIRPISSTAPGNLHERTLFATRAALRELKKLVDDGMTQEALATTQQFLKNYSINWGSTISRRLAYTVDDEYYGVGGDGFLASIRPSLVGLGLAGVNAAIQRHLQYGDLYIVMITRDAEAMKEKLLSGVATPITYTGEKSAEHMAEDKLIASFPIPVTAENITIIGIDDVFEVGPPTGGTTMQ
jgi:zinc protease